MASGLVNRAENKGFKGFEKEKESNWSGPFFFIQGADTQFGMIDSYRLKKAVPGWEKEIRLTKTAINAVNSMNPRPRFFVVCGDLVHDTPGETYRVPQEEDFFKVFSELHPDIPLVCVCGNHDIGNTPTPASVQNYRDRFGDDYFTFFCSGVMFIVINSQFFEDPSLVQELAKEHEDWLETQLMEAEMGGYKHVVIFQHIPLFLKNPDEEKQYFNFEIDVRKKLLQKFYDANIRAIFCGHYHRNGGGFYQDLELVVTSAIGCQLGRDKSGFRIVKIQENSITHEYHQLDNVPLNISLK